MTTHPEVITINDRYDQIIKEGAENLSIIEAQATIAIWGVMKTVHDTCEEALSLLEKFGVSGPGQWRAQKENNLSSMSKTYKDLSFAAGKSVSWVNNAHICFKKTLQFIGSEEEVISLSLPPSVATAVVKSSKIDDNNKQILLAKAIKKALTKSQVLREIRVLSGEEEEHPIFRTNLWSVKSPEQMFGMIFPGRLPGQIAYNVLHHYTEPGDLCLFPFVGGGTEADVAKYMGREYYAWDIHNVDEVARKHKERYFTANSLAPWTITNILDEKADLVFADPPRFMWGNGTWEDSDDEKKYDISNQDLGEFIESMELVALNAFRALKTGGRFAILLRQPGFVDIPSEDIAITLVNTFQQFELLNRLHVSFPTTEHRPDKKGSFANECMDLLILEKR